jgi:hypothetical protein
LSLYHQDGTVCPTIHETRQTGHGADEVKICLTTQEAICTADQQVVKLARQLDIDAEVARNTKELLYKRIHTIGARVDGALASRNHAALAVNRLRVAVLGLAGDIALGHFEDLLHPLTPKQICDMMMEIIGVDALPEIGDLKGSGMPDPSHQGLGGAAVETEADVDEGQQEVRRARGHDQVRGQGQRAPDPDRGTVDGRDHGLGERPHPQDQRVVDLPQRRQHVRSAIA